MAIVEEKIEIRSYEEQRDRVGVEELERICEVGPAERAFLLLTDTLGDPICRIRNTPIYTMLVAELRGEKVGVIRGTIKMVTLENAPSNRAMVGYILGLRVSPLHRRKGIGTELVHRLLLWFAAHGVAYAYMATEKDNAASIALFVHKLGFHVFRTPSILVNPVTRRRRCGRPCRCDIDIAKLTPQDAESLYRTFMGSAEFFPQDIDAVLHNRLSLGTWVAYPSAEKWTGSSISGIDIDVEKKKRMLPRNWAMVSVWNSGEVFKLRLGEAPLFWRICARGSRWMGRALPCLGMPVVPDFFKPFGFYFVYGVHREGASGGKLVRSLFEFVRGMAGEAKCGDCKVVVTEIGGCCNSDASLRPHVPHSKWLSCPEDLWCIKPLFHSHSSTNLLFAPTPRALFVDPREV